MAAGGSAASRTPRDEQLIDALVQTSFLTMAVLTRVGAAHDLSLTQLRVLAILRDRRLRMTALADYLGLDKSSLSGLVDRAAKRGLLERVADPADRRAVDVVITAEGARLAERMYADVARALSPATSELVPPDRHRLAALLAQLLGRDADPDTE